MADSTTPNIAQANEAASPVNPLLERARNRIAARRDLETSDTSPSSERMVSCNKILLLI